MPKSLDAIATMVSVMQQEHIDRMKAALAAQAVRRAALRAPIHESTIEPGTFLVHSEALFEQASANAGWVARKGGFPDFWCREARTGKEILVEVKRFSNEPLRNSQIHIWRFLLHYNVPIYLWSPDVGFHKTWNLREQIEGNNERKAA